MRLASEDTHASQPTHGLGRALLAAAEAEASFRGREQVMISTRGFQSPVLHERAATEAWSSPVGSQKAMRTSSMRRCSSPGWSRTPRRGCVASDAQATFYCKRQ